MFKMKKIHTYILLGFFIILIAGMWIVTNLKYRVIIKDNIFIGIKDGIIEKKADIQTMEIPDGVTEIDLFAFNGCTNLESVEIPDSVRRIGMNAFSNCKKLSKISLHFQIVCSYKK